MDLKFEDGNVHEYHTELFQPVNVAESKFEILSTKIEITLKKANGYSWASIEPNQSNNLLTIDITSFTTFGLQGNTGGTVGAKEAVIAGDTPLHLLEKQQR